MSANPHTRPARSAVLLVLLATAAGGCIEGPVGPAGDAGAQGESGSACWDLNSNGAADPDSEDLNGDGAVDVYDCQGLAGDGEDGEDGEDWEPPDYTGAEICLDCHEEQYEAWRRSGMANALLATGGTEPTEPWDELGGFGEYSSDPPDDLSWSDVSYVMGGWAWKQVVVDSEGYVYTGESAAYAIESGDWITYHEEDDPGTLQFDCAQCHTTGYRAEGSQGDLPGVVGTWEAEGVGCEVCHGPGEQHVDMPYDVPMSIDRSAELCGDCHSRGSAGTILAEDGYITDVQQWNELFHSKKHSMDCVDCHNPHQSVRYDDDDYNEELGRVVFCEECHFDEAANQGSSIMSSYVPCEDCHMPLAGLVAEPDNTWAGDLRTHLFGVNVDVEAEQFSDGGGEANPYLTLDFACRSCHSDEGAWTEYSDEELESLASGYHDRE